LPPVYISIWESLIVSLRPLDNRCTWGLQHIIIRGIERKPIFKDNQDYRNFLKRLGNVVRQTETSCYAWVLMTNHVLC